MPNKKTSNPTVSKLKRLLCGIKLKVLILGPGPTGGAIYRKRCDIRKMVKNMGHEADFCEDVWKPAVLASSGLNLAVGEFVQAITYDYVVCLMASPGSIGEVHDFGTEPKIASKMMVCIDRRHKHGYSANGVLKIFQGMNGKLDWFRSPNDLDECHLAGRVIEQIRCVAYRKQWELRHRI